MVLLNSIVQRDSKACSTPFGDELVVVSNLDHGNLYRLNPVSVDLWQWLEEPKTIDELSQFLRQKYHGHLEDYQQDVIDWVNDNRSKGLLLDEIAG